MATYDITQSIPENYIQGDILNCPYSGRAITMTLKRGTYHIEAWGSSGGTYSTQGGAGGYSCGDLTLAAPRVVYFYSGDTTTVGGGGGTSRYGARGGGGSDLRLGVDSLLARVIVAGGGGGAGYSSTTGGYGGGESGGQGGNGSATGGYGASQTSGGTNNTPGTFGVGGTTSAGGGGGGGWYGGASGVGSGTDAGGGGGSGYIYTSATAGNYPSGCLLTSADYLSNAQTIAGNQTITEPGGGTQTGHRGTGYIRITVLATSYGGKYKQNGNWVNAAIYSKVSGSWITNKEMMENYPLSIKIPSQQNELHEKLSGQVLYPQWNSHTSSYINVSGTTSAVHEGTYYATMSLKKSNYSWADKTKDDKQIPWVIGHLIPYDYGDGSGNLTQNFYNNDNLYINNNVYRYQYVGTKSTNGWANCHYNDGYNSGMDCNTFNKDEAEAGKMAATWINLGNAWNSYLEGNYDNRYSWLYDTTKVIPVTNSAGAKTNISSGTNTLTFVNTLPAEYTLYMRFQCGGYTTGVNIGAVKYCVNGTFYTPQQLVENGYIKPLILYGSESWSGSYVWSNIYNVYTGGTTSTGNYPTMELMMMTNVAITGVQLTTNREWSTTYDGVWSAAIPTDDVRLTVAQY